MHFALVLRHVNEYIIPTMERKFTYTKKVLRGLLLLSFLGLAAFTIPAQTKISAMTAKALKDLMDAKKDLVLLDVRTLEEYQEAHIPGALLLPYDQINAANALKAIGKDKNRTIVVYCRSGRRSEIAASSLANLGYTRIFDLGAIAAWPFGTVKGTNP